jgi:hypothetical protein
MRTSVNIRIGDKALILSYEEFSDLANCCHELAERNNTTTKWESGRVAVEIERKQ